MSFGSRHTEILLSLLLLTSWIREYTCHVGNCSCTSDNAGSHQFGCSNVNCTSDPNGYLLAFTDLLLHGNISNNGVIQQTEESYQFVSTMLDQTSGKTSWTADERKVTCTQANAFTSMAYDCISGPCITLCDYPGVNKACVMTTGYPYESSGQHRECICQLSTTSNYVQVKMHDNNLMADQTLELISEDSVVHQWNRTTAKGRAPSIGETLNISAEHTITLRWKNPTMQNESFFIGFYANTGTIILNCSQPVSTTKSPAATKPTDIPTTTYGSVSETSKTELPSSAQSSPASKTHTSIDATITDAVTSASSATENSSDTSASVRTETETSTKGTDAHPSFSTGTENIGSGTHTGAVDSTSSLISEKTPVETSTADSIAVSAAPVQSNTKGFPIWIIFLILGILLVASIIGYIVYRKKKKGNQVNPDQEHAHEDNGNHGNKENKENHNAPGILPFIPSTSGFWESSKMHVESNTPSRNKFNAVTARNIDINDKNGGLLTSESSKKKKKKKKKRHADLEQDKHFVDNQEEDATAEPGAETHEQPRKKKKKRKKRQLEEGFNGEKIGNQTETINNGTLGGVDYDHLL